VICNFSEFEEADGMDMDLKWIICKWPPGTHMESIGWIVVVQGGKYMVRKKGQT
jgi:hypothetical protein